MKVTLPEDLDVVYANSLSLSERWAYLKERISEELALEMAVKVAESLKKSTFPARPRIGSLGYEKRKIFLHGNNQTHVINVTDRRTKRWILAAEYRPNEFKKVMKERRIYPTAGQPENIVVTSRGTKKTLIIINLSMPKFNILNYRLLLAKTESIEKRDITILDNPSYMELISYKTSVYTQLFYNNRDTYFNLVKDFLNGRVTPFYFRITFTNMVSKDMEDARNLLEDFDKLSEFWVDLELETFSSLFNEINENCRGVLEFEDEITTSEEDFRNSIETIFTQIQNY